MQLGIILKREHPGIIEKKEGDVVIKTRPALEWSDYYDDDTLDDKGQTAADRVKQVFWKADVISTAREKKLRPSTSASYQRTVQENEELKRRNENLQNKVDMHERLFLALFKELGKELPEELRQGASSQPHGATNSSHIVSRALDDNTGDGDSGGNVGGDNSSGNISDLAIGATNLRTNNVSVGGGNTSSNNRESET